MWEQSLIDEGKLLPSRQGKKLGPEDDEFAVSVDEFLATRQAAIVSTAGNRVQVADRGLGADQQANGAHLAVDATQAYNGPAERQETSPEEHLAKLTGRKPRSYTKGQKKGTE